MGWVRGLTPMNRRRRQSRRRNIEAHMTHIRNTGPMTSSPRCGASTRMGTPCLSPAVSGKKRCRMHGGSKGSGAPTGNRNAYVTGDYTRENIEGNREVGTLIRDLDALLLQYELIRESRVRAKA